MLQVHPTVASAQQALQPVVALESTLIAHGLPWPLNLETARMAESAVLEEGAVPATIAVLRGVPNIGLTDGEMEELARGIHILKASRRDLAVVMAQKRSAATTVAGTSFLAHQAGIRLLATGGIGGAHRGEGNAWDISADLFELARTPVAVVCAGAKSILDIPRTLEILESLGVPVIGYRTSDFPAFYQQYSGESVSGRVDSAEEAAALLQTHWSLEGKGVVIAQAVVAELALDGNELEAAIAAAEAEARTAGVRSKELTPFLLARLAELTGGKTLRANQALVVENARLAGRIARNLDSRGAPIE